MNAVVFGVLAYVLAQLLVGVAVSRRIRTEADYLLAGRSLGYPLAIFSIFATWFGAETCIGAAGSTYANGLSGGTSDPFGYALCLLLMGTLFATALWKRNLFTLADLFRERYSPAVERLAVLLMVPTSLIWGGAQIRAFGQVLSAASGAELTVTITIAAAVVIVYTAFGGLLADAMTDVVQGICLSVGLVVLLVAVVAASGGPTAAASAIAGSNLDLLGGGRGTSGLDLAEAWLVPIVGSVTAQELISRVLASRSARVAKRSTLAASAIYLVIGLVPVALGLLGARLLPGLEHPEQILPLLAQRYLGTFLHVVFAGAVVSAILSTVDSSLLAASSVVSHNVVLRYWTTASEPAKVRTARVGVVAAGLIAYALAFSSEGVYGLVEQASAFGGAGMAVVMAAALFTRWGGPAAAFAALAAGAVVQIGGTYVTPIEHPFTLSLVVSAATYSTVTLFAKFLGWSTSQPRSSAM